MKNLFLFFFILQAIVGFGQSEEALSIKKRDIDTTYIQDISDDLIIKLNTDNNIVSYKYLNNDSGRQFEIKSSQIYKTFFSVDYKFLGMAISIPQEILPFSDEDNKEGKSKSLSLGLSFFLNRWLQNLNYSYTKGFYLTDATNANTSLPNLSKTKYSGTTSYVINNKKFSYYAHYYQTNIQKISAGSFIPTLNYYYLYSNDVDKNTNISYNENLLYANLAICYQYNWVPMDKILISAGISSGIGINYSEKMNSSQSDKTKFYSNNFTFNTNFTLSYRFEKLFVGAQFYTNSIKSKENEITSLSNNINYGVFFVGYRFKAPKIIERPFNWIENKF